METALISEIRSLWSYLCKPVAKATHSTYKEWKLFLVHKT